MQLRIRKFVLISFLAVFGCLTARPASAKITLPAIISDGMVLQQKADDPLWGWAAPGEEITITGSWNNKAVSTHTDRYGKWEVAIPVPEAGGPYTVTIRGEERVVLHNVMIGEVWLCSGQSNMEMPVSGWPSASILHSKEEIANADYPGIHMFTAQRNIAITPQRDNKGNWEATTPETVGHFSATAYFFGRQLHEKLGVPIGLIHSSWGGTVAEAWTSKNALRTIGDFNQILDTLSVMEPQLDKIKKKDQQRQEAWQQALNNTDEAVAKKDYDDSDWKTMDLPVKWEQAGLPGIDGIVWFRRTVTIPDEWAGKKLTLNLGPIDDNDITWFNGEQIGSTEGYSIERSYTIPSRLVKSGANEIAVRAVDGQGDGGFYGEKEAMNIKSESGNKNISLAGNWKYHLAAVKKPPLAINNPNTPSVLFNGMIAPLIPYHIRGAIWYQGESNVGRANQYTPLFSTMIQDWRQRWNEGSFPFYFVQIAPFPYGGDGTNGAALRDAQRRTLSLEHTGMAVTMGVGDTTNIHPANKQEVGRRLSFWALSQTYGKGDMVYSGPLAKNMKVEGDKIIVSFVHTADGLVAKNGSLDGFEIAGSDGNFVNAQAIIKDDQVVVRADGITNPVAVRYAWRDKAQPTLLNTAGLPASTFKMSSSTD